MPYAITGSHHSHKEATNTKERGEREEPSPFLPSFSLPPPRLGSRLRPLLRVSEPRSFSDGYGERATERAQRDGEEQAVYRAAICRESFSKQCKCSTTSPPPPPPNSSPLCSIAVARQACLLPSPFFLAERRRRCNRGTPLQTRSGGNPLPRPPTTTLSLSLS